MPDDNHNFLRLTFDGGRFAGHSVPVAVLAELATLQDLIFAVARQLFLDEDTERKRLPKGFASEAQLFLATTEHNCFTAGLARPNGAGSHARYFESARDVSIAALAASAQPGGTLPTNFPKQAFKPLAAVGRRLGADEGMIVKNGVGPGAKVTKYSRERLAAMVHIPLELEEALDGEVEKVDDATKTFVLRRKNEKLEVPFQRHERELLGETWLGRPVLGIHFRGTVIVSPTAARKVKSVEELDVFEHPRADEVRKLWARLDHLEQIGDGWIEGEGVAPTESAITTAHDVLGRLLVDHDWADRPKIFPTPEGGVQAEWMIGAWVCEVVFAPDGKARGEATHTESDQELEIELDSVDATNADQLAAWLYKMTSHGDEERV